MRRVDTLENLMTHVEMSVDDLVESNSWSQMAFGKRAQADCKKRDDMLKGEQAAWRWYTLRAVTSQTVRNCSSVRSLCDDATLPIVRVMCPDTCGCVDPIWPLSQARLQEGML